MRRHLIVVSESTRRPHNWTRAYADQNPISMASDVRKALQWRSQRWSVFSQPERSARAPDKGSNGKLISLLGTCRPRESFHLSFSSALWRSLEPSTLSSGRGLPAAASLPRGVAAAAQAETAPFDRSSVRQLARDAASKPYKAPDTKLPDNLKNLDYDHYRQIRFLPEHALWRGDKLPFEVQFFHRGFFYAPRVDIYEVANGQATKIAYRVDDFSFGSNVAAASRYGSGLRRLSDSRADQPARLLRRSLRLSWRELLPRRRQGRDLRPVRARAGHQHRRGQGRGISRCSRRSGSRSRPRTPIPSSCMRCSTARARRPPIASR